MMLILDFESECSLPQRHHCQDYQQTRTIEGNFKITEQPQWNSQIQRRFGKKK
jgi:hypothetical protein